MLPLRQSSALDDLQRYVADMEKERGFAQRDVVQQCLPLRSVLGSPTGLLGRGR